MPSWHQSLIDAFRKPQDLADYLGIAPPAPAPAAGQNVDFPMLVPRGFAARMEKGNPKDPLLLQVMPSLNEENADTDYCQDPLAEADATVAPGVLRKYQGRVLLVTTGACPSRCRYCFRRHFPYCDSVATGPDLEPAIEYIHANQDITEVILSGGDPLMLDNQDLTDLIGRLEEVAHLQRLRIHSRVPVMLPERVDPELAQLLTANRFRIALVIHCNHANELNLEVQQALNILTKSGITILNQSVLLRDINDNAEVLHTLSERLFSYGALPYYLHSLDRVAGAMHFEVTSKKAKSIHRQLQDSLPGYLVPRLVYEKAGATSKLTLS